MNSIRRILPAAMIAAVWLGSSHAQEAPSTVTFASTVTPADAEGRHITSLEGIAAASPSLALVPTFGSANSPNIFMRGQGQTTPAQMTRDGAVAIYQDGFYIARGQAITFDLLDLERADVLAGPQGAAYGRDSSGGVINLVSKAPTGTLRFEQTADFGNRDSYRVLSSLDTPQWHSLSAKVTLLASSISGDVRNLDSQSHDYGEEKQRAARLQLRWEPLQQLHAAYFLERSSLDGTPAYDSNPAQNGQQLYFPFTYYADPDRPPASTYRPINLPLSTSDHTAQGLTLSWQASPLLAVESLTGYRTLDSHDQQDYAEFFGYPQGSEDLYAHHQFSQELRFSGGLFGRQLDWRAGVVYFKERGTHTNGFLLFAQDETIVRQVQAATRSQAAYLSLHWEPAFANRRLGVTAAGRYTKDSKDAERIISVNTAGVVESGANRLSYDRVDPAVTLDYRWRDNVDTYATFSTAYQAGGALESAPLGQFSSSTFRPESVRGYEVGLKSSLLDDRLHVTFAGFGSQYRDIQYALPSDAITDRVYDLQKATVWGADLDLRATPLRDLTLTAGVAYLRWRMDRVDVVPGSIFDPASGSGSPFTLGDNLKDVFALPFAPEYSATVGGDYALLHLDRKDVSVHLDYDYRAGMYSDAAAGAAVPGRQFDTIPAYGLLNGRVSLVQETDWSHHVTFSVWGRNILNRKYYQSATGVGAGLTAFATTGGVTPAGYTARGGAWAEPATYGLTVKYEY